MRSPGFLAGMLTCSRVDINTGNAQHADITLCTHAANNARVNVPDDRFRWLVDVYKPKSEVPAFLEIVDIAGLVKCALSSPDGLHSTWIPTPGAPFSQPFLQRMPNLKQM